MSRELRRLLIEPRRLAQAAAGRLELLPPERHYLVRVLRLRPGDRLIVVDGAGHLWTARLAETEQLRLEQSLEAPLKAEPEPAPALELAMALPKRDAELVWRMATELGADRLQPLTAQRSVRQGEPPLERWAALLREASEQCERLWLPRLEPLEAATDWLARPPAGLGLLATTRRFGLPSLAELLGDPAAWPSGLPDAVPSQRGRELGRTAVVSLAIGPEGGWSEQEESAAETAGWRPVSLGPTILRTGTAAVAGIALLAAARGTGPGFSSSSSRGPSP